MNSLVRSRTRLLLSTVLGAAVVLPIQAYAQTADNSGGIEEIVVTAQKREQSIQDVPVAVTALNPETLKVNRVVNVMDLNGLAPGLTARQNPGSLGSPSYSMRGVFASASVPAQDRQISSYLDGVYIGGARGAVFDLPDLERIEVLRGPQGTLFGRNATAGAVSIVTRDPKGEFGARQEVTVGNYAQLRTRTTIDTPQMGIFSAYVTYVHDERRGDTRNLGAGTTFDRQKSVTGFGVSQSPKWLGSKNAENVFAAAKLAPNDDFSLTYKFDYSHANNTPEARVPIAINPADPTLVGGLFAAVIAAQPAGGGRFGAVPLFPDYQRPSAVNNAWTMPGFAKSSGHNLTLNWRATDHLSFKNVASYRTAETVGLSTIMGLSGLEYTQAAKDFYNAPRAFLGGASYAQIFDSAVPFAQRGQEPVGSYFMGYEGQSYGKYHQFSNELQANYQSELLTLTVGGIYFQSHELSSGIPNAPANLLFAPIGTVLPLGGNIQKTVQDTKSYAGYAQAEVHITPEFDLTAGARLTHDDKWNSFTNGGTYDPTLNSITGSSVTIRTFKKTKPTFSVGANYKIKPDVLVYGKFSTAYLSGGSSGAVSFEPETVASWEAGLKSEWLNRRLRLNLALWQATYKHSQAAQSGQNVKIPACGVNGVAAQCTPYGVVVIDNGTINAKGIEAEAVVVPVEGLTFGGSFSYTDTKWKSPSPFLAQGFPVAPSSLPKYTGGINGQYVTPPLFGDATMLFRLDAVYTGKYRNSPYTDIATRLPALAPYAYTPATWILNGRVALRDIDVGGVKGQVAVWARNLTDNKNPLSVLIFGSSEVNANYQPARTFGADFTVEF
ncbi:TonB-dependent receptor [Novosphingobium sp. G106]|uniref:TonB-dependent receptor n=1 Tax=Novosphingobium sp. G106 TaxID=2849500 RepID=UPI001C2D5DE8|nr:TonB-dependent receptor [Novosphingobium sp. G106]MBV1687307.1 TonB-dependent receptor [Novosphingobium sp. G106]